eukprot:m.89999 g.89999  ORF g.89999 m.89999 type:complete len:210 (-) comp26354_c0_seq4:61-690(-)
MTACNNPTTLVASSTCSIPIDGPVVGVTACTPDVDVTLPVFFCNLVSTTSMTRFETFLLLKASQSKNHAMNEMRTTESLPANSGGNPRIMSASRANPTISNTDAIVVVCRLPVGGSRPFRLNTVYCRMYRRRANVYVQQQVIDACMQLRSMSNFAAAAASKLLSTYTCTTQRHHTPPPVYKYDCDFHVHNKRQIDTLLGTCIYFQLTSS